jgi:hypothetical protein
MRKSITTTMTPAELVGWLEGHPNRGVKLATVVSTTEPKMTVKSRITKEPNTYAGALLHYMVQNVPLGSIYEAAVNRQREAESKPTDFVPELLWHGAGQRHGSYTVMNKNSGRVYFAFKPATQVEGREVQVKVLASAYFTHVGGKLRKLTQAEIDFCRAHYFDLPSNNARHQGVRSIHETKWQTLMLENVQQVNYGGQCIKVKHDQPATIDFIPATITF